MSVLWEYFFPQDLTFPLHHFAVRLRRFAFGKLLLLLSLASASAVFSRSHSLTIATGTSHFRTWRERLHVNEQGNVFIPPMSFKNCLGEAAKYKSIQIPGKGKSTYTKHFEAGVMVCDPLVLPIKADEVKGESLHVPSDGRRGGTTRVVKTFPVITSWEGDVEFIILDELINADVFLSHLSDAGRFIGIGRFRPRNNGYYGRFEVVNVKWS